MTLPAGSFVCGVCGAQLDHRGAMYVPVVNAAYPQVARRERRRRTMRRRARRGWR